MSFLWHFITLPCPFRGKEVYDVSMFYWDTGFSQRIARSRCFENITLFMIAVNSVWIWIDTDPRRVTA